MNDLRQRLSRVRLIASDIDGVLTDGNITMAEDHSEIRNFSALDGMGLTLAKEFGLDVVFISGKVSRAAVKRLGDLGFNEVHQDVQDKGPVLEEILAKRRVSKEEVCALGDDLADLPLFRRSEVAVAVQNAVRDVKERAHFTTARRGGEGALRELVEEILKAKGQWPKVLERFGG